jgi:folylpolyglutamate synthase
MHVIRERAHELEASEVIEIKEADIYKMKTLNLGRFLKLSLGISGKYQSINAALAKALCRKWTEACGKVDGWNDEKAHEGLKMTHFAGRSQTFKQGDITWLFDGAHTAESMNCCVDWAKSSAQTFQKRYFPN